MMVKVVSGGGKSPVVEQYEDRGPGEGHLRGGNQAGGGTIRVGSKAPPSMSGSRDSD